MSKLKVLPASLTPYLQLLFQLLMARALVPRLHRVEGFDENGTLDAMDAPWRLLTADDQQTVSAAKDWPVESPEWESLFMSTVGTKWERSFGSTTVDVRGLMLNLYKLVSSPGALYAMDSVVGRDHVLGKMVDWVVDADLSEGRTRLLLQRAAVVCHLFNVKPEDMARTVILHHHELDVMELMNGAHVLLSDNDDKRSIIETTLFALLSHRRFHIQCLIGRGTTFLKVRKDREFTAIRLIDDAFEQFEERMRNMEIRVDNVACHLKAHLSGGEP